MDHLTPGFGPLELELLDDAEQRRVEAHLDGCAECAAEYRLSAEALADLALSLPRSTPSPAVRERVMKSVSATNRFEKFAAQVAALIDVSVDKARELVGRIDDAKSWMATHVEGVFSYDLPAGPAVADAVVGFVTAVGDGVLAAFIPLLEVLPAYRGRGIGAELVRRVLARLSSRYSIDLVCDPDLVPYYERLGGQPLAGIGWRNRAVLEP